MEQKNEQMNKQTTVQTVAIANTEKMQKFLETDLKKVTAKLKPQINLVRNYFDLNENETKDYFYMGETTYLIDENTGEFRPAILLMDTDKNIYVAPHTVLVNATKNVELYTPLRISNKGKEKGNKYITFDVVMLG